MVVRGEPFAAFEAIDATLGGGPTAADAAAESGEVAVGLSRAPAPVADDAGHPESSTDLSRAHAALLAERDRADRMSRELETLCYAISHDLRAPLRAVDGFSHALSVDYGAALDDEGRGYIQRIRKAAERMSAQIDGLLELSRIQAAPLRPTRVDLSHLARRICDDLARQNPERSVSVEIEPNQSAWGDPHLAGLLLAHLISNAWKFTRTRAQPRVAFCPDRSAGACAWLVSDNGVGFNSTYSSRLFTPFQRLHKESEFEGIGLGLALAQRIVSRHDGRIWAQAEADKGATFSFTLGNQP